MTTRIPIVDVTRRQLLKSSLAASAALSLGFPVAQEAAAAPKKGLVWHRGVCRFCGTGCGIEVGVLNGKVIGTRAQKDNPVNQGLLCMKGYFNSKLLYAKDRLTTPLIRKKDGVPSKDGQLEPATWDEAFDLIEKNFRRVYQEKGPAGVAMVTSGQNTIPEAYAASKLWKGGFRSNNIDPNARFCMASAVVAFYQVFGIDEPANVYADFEKSEDVIFWGNNMAEVHPVLWARLVGHHRNNPKSRIINITTYRNLSSELADDTLVIKPMTDLAVANYLLREIIARGKVNQAFVDQHCIFATGPRDIGFGLRGDDKLAYDAEKDVLAKQKVVRLSQAQATAEGLEAGLEVKQEHTGPKASEHWSITFEDFKKGVEPYTLDFVAELAKGDDSQSLDAFKAQLQNLADIVCGDTKLMSLWCMGMNQHQRGVWINELVYSIHLLQGKYAQPGVGAFSLTGQPSACGSAREVGTFAHRLPADMLVNIPKHREITENLWKIPQNTLNPKVGKDLLAMMRGLEDGSVNFMWTQVVNVFQSAPNNTHWLKAAKKPENFIVVSDVYPTFSTSVADVVLPAAFHFEKWGAYGNGERRTQAWGQMVEAPGEARTDVWMMQTFAKRFKVKDTYGAQPLQGVENNQLPDVLSAAQAQGLDPEMSLYDVLFKPAPGRSAEYSETLYPNTYNSTGDALGTPDQLPEKALFEEYRQFTLGHGHDLATFDTYLKESLVWPVVNGKETLYRFNPDYDPYVKDGKLFYGPLLKAIPSGDLFKVTNPEKVPLPGKAKIFFRPYQDPCEMPNKEYPLWLCTGRVLEHWHTGTMTRRVPELDHAQPVAFLYMNPDDAKALGIERGDVAKVESRHGSCQAFVETVYRNLMPRGSTWLAFFDEKAMVNSVVLDSTDPLSLEPDFKKTAVRIKKIG